MNDLFYIFVYDVLLWTGIKMKYLWTTQTQMLADSISSTSPHFVVAWQMCMRWGDTLVSSF